MSLTDDDPYQKWAPAPYDPGQPQPALRPSPGEYMTTEEVCGALARGGVDEATVGKIFAARLQPQNLDDADRDRKFAMGVPGPNGTAYLIVYRFGPGTPLARKDPFDEDGPDWRPRWLSVEGPFDGTDRKAVEDKARELTAA